MGRSRNRKKERKNSIVKKENRPENKEHQDKRTIKKILLVLTKFWKGLNIAWKIMGVVFVLATGYLTFIQIYDWHREKPNEDIVVVKDNRKTIDKFKAQNIDTGDLKGPLIFKNYNAEALPKLNTQALYDSIPPLNGILLKDNGKTIVDLKLGSNYFGYPIEKFLDGLPIQIAFPEICGSYILFFGIKDNRLYISVKIKDLVTGDIIGYIEFNRWLVYLQNLIDYNYNDESLEIIDKRGQVVFSLKYLPNIKRDAHVVEVKGYFVTDESIIVLSENGGFPCYPKNNPKAKKEALEQIELIKKIFP